MGKFSALSALLLCLPLTAAAQETTTPKTLVKIDGTPITQLHFALYSRDAQQVGTQTDPQAQMALMNQLVNIAILAKTAESEDLAQHPEVAAELELTRMKVLAQAALRDYFAANPVSDAEVQAAYQAKYKQPSYEFKARHILVPTKEAAEDLIAQIKKGADFSELAKQHSTGPSGKNGGDLGWFEPEQMVPPFAEATAQLAVGAVTPEPVKTQFGWHVIQLDDKRERPKPALDQVKQELKNQLQREHAATYMRAAREKVKVEVQPPTKDKKDYDASNK